jgi:MAF protein
VKRLVLASSSPRRYELMQATGLSFEVARPDIDETPQPGEAPTDYVLRLSGEKAQAIARSTSVDSAILSADTTVVHENEMLGKPANDADAIEMLRRLRGARHEVYTGVTVYDMASTKNLTRLTASHVLIRNLTDGEIAAYVASGDPMGKAGSYAIQNVEFHPVARLDGCYTNVIGLPLCTVCVLLAEVGIGIPLPIKCSPENLPCQFGHNR